MVYALPNSDVFVAECARAHAEQFHQRRSGGRGGGARAAGSHAESYSARLFALVPYLGPWFTCAEELASLLFNPTRPSTQPNSFILTTKEEDFYFSRVVPTLFEYYRNKHGKVSVRECNLSPLEILILPFRGITKILGSRLK